MKFLSNFLIFIVISLLLPACASLVSHDREPKLEGKLQVFNKQLVKGGDFLLTTYQKITDPQAPYVFYIEGDGYIIISNSMISDDPTPRKPMLLQLAALDARPNVVYIARPCQYTPMDLNAKCTEVFWLDKRMSEEVIYSVNEVVDTISGGKPFSLIGFSGGGGVAVLVAARNNHTKDILTIAANLDHKSFNKYHRTKQMTGSLNPVDYALQVNNIPQLHLSGGKDKRVPSFIAEDYVKASRSPCVHNDIVPNVEHQKGWDKVWPQLLSRPLTCY